MTFEELKKEIHFRTIDAPCCGNCKWLRVFSCNWQFECWKSENRCDNNYRAKVYANAVCDRFERREDKNA
jgi:hypothetical protein